MATVQKHKKLPNGRRNAKADEVAEKKEAIIETVAAWIEALEKEYGVEIEYNINNINF